MKHLWVFGKIWRVALVCLIVLAPLIFDMVSLEGATEVNDDFRLQLEINNTDALAPQKLEADPTEPITVHLVVDNFRYQGTHMDKLSFTILLFGHVNVGTYNYDLGGEYNPGDIIDETFPSITPSITLGNLKIPWMTGTHRIAATLSYSIDGQAKSWSQTKDIALGSVWIMVGEGVAILIVAAGVVSATVWGLSKLFSRGRPPKPSRLPKMRPPDTTPKPAPAEKAETRFLQEKTLIEQDGRLIPENRAFFKGVSTHIRLHIGIKEESWLPLGTPFPENRLPPNRKEWALDVVLSEMHHLDKVMRQQTVLPDKGSSSECEFTFKPKDAPIFAGRVTVLYRGRVLQTGILKGVVVENEKEITSENKIAFSEISIVRAQTAELEKNRPFDMAFVENHAVDGTPTAQALSKEADWIINLARCNNEIKALNQNLTEAAKQIKDIQGTLNSKIGSEIMCQLARNGFFLRQKIMQDRNDGSEALAKARYLQIVSTNPSSLVPFEFVYDFPYPEDGAKTCNRWKQALEDNDGDCTIYQCLIKEAENQKNGASCQIVCPLGFWGLNKVIERVIRSGVEPEKASLYKEPTAGSHVLSLEGTAVVAVHKDKDYPLDLKNLIEECRTQFGKPAIQAGDWSDWFQKVQENTPHVLIALAHREGDGPYMTLEIGGKEKLVGAFTGYYFQKSGDATRPLVALLGCDSTGTGLSYGAAVEQIYSTQAPSVIIGTIAEVFGPHAVEVAEMLVKRLKIKGEDNQAIGDIMKALKRDALSKGYFMGLCLVAFGDSDWELQ